MLEITQLPPGGKKCPPNDKQNSKRAYVSESVGTSQPSSHTGKRNNLSLSTLGVVAQSSMLQLLSLISVDGKNRWIFFSGATYHLTGSFESFFFLYFVCR